MVNVYDFYYDKVNSAKLSKQKLLDILDQISKLNSFGSNKKTSFDLFLLIAKSPNADDEVIKQLVKHNLKGSVTTMNLTYQIIDFGSKQLFEELWGTGIENFKSLKLWKSKHTDAKKLEEIYKEYFSTERKDVSKTWLDSERKQFLKHPNAPEKILARVGYIKNLDFLIVLAENTNIISKKKVFDQITSVVKAHSIYEVRYDLILEVFLKNASMDWDTIAKAIDLRKQLHVVFDQPETTTTRRKTMLIEFCKSKECDNETKNYIFEKTQDLEFLPQIVKDVFLF